MDANLFMQAVGSLGFPVVCCAALFYYLNKERESHAEEVKTMTQALNQNTNVMIELKSMLSLLTGVQQYDGRIDK